MGTILGRSTLLCWALGTLMTESAMGSEEWVRAERAIDIPQFSRRQTYQGGWSMGITGSQQCAAGLQQCKSSITNPSCCPSGSSCYGLSALYCCPTESDCKSFVENFPQCADPDNVLYVLDAVVGTYFCCPVSQFGVLPISGRGGFCQDVGTSADPTRVAIKAVDQKITRAVTTTAFTLTTRTTTLGSGETSTLTVTSSFRTTYTETVNVFQQQTTISSTTANANPSTPTGTAASGSGGNQTNGTNNGNNSSGGSGLSSGAIAGIVIGALAVLGIFILAWVLYRRKKPAADANKGGGGDVPPSYNGYTQPMEQQHDHTNYPIPVTHQSPGGSNAGLMSSSSGYSPAQGTISTQSAEYGSHGGPPPAANEVQGSINWNNGRAELGTGR